MARKIADRKTLLSILKDSGFKLIERSKHEKWSDGNKTIIIPHKHSSGKFSRMLAERIVKEAGIV